jgi:hypothetical protein
MSAEMNDLLKLLIIEDSEDDALFTHQGASARGFELFYERVDTAGGDDQFAQQANLGSHHFGLHHAEF